jgi:hypothetical protein
VCVLSPRVASGHRAQFVFPQQAVYRREGAERHRERLFARFDRTLRRCD